MQNQMFDSNLGVLGSIQKAAKDKKTLIISYEDSKGVVTQREVEPYEIKNGGLFAYCYSRDCMRNFKLDKIHEAKVTSKSYTPKWPVQI